MSEPTAMVPHTGALDRLAELAEVYRRSGLFADVASTTQAMVKVRAGRELGITDLGALRGLRVGEGKLEVSAELQAVLVRSSGRYDYRVRAVTNERAAVEFFAIGPGGREPLGLSEFTIDDAKRADLLGKTAWKRYPRNMLLARALTNGVTWFCPDVLAVPRAAAELATEVIATAEPAEVVEEDEPAELTPAEVDEREPEPVGPAEAEPAEHECCDGIAKVPGACCDASHEGEKPEGCAHTRRSLTPAGELACGGCGVVFEPATAEQVHALGKLADRAGVAVGELVAPAPPFTNKDEAATAIVAAVRARNAREQAPVGA